MASTLEQEILDKFHQLDGAAQSRVIEKMRGIIQANDESFDFDEWLASAQTLRAEIQADIGEGNTTGALGLLDELREESS